MINDGLTIATVPCTPYADQSMGTAGLRKKVAVVMQRNYLESFLQALLGTLNLPPAATLCWIRRGPSIQKSASSRSAIPTAK